ncbi:MAG: hypothetical protein JXR03_04800 [Cyclobacteriaceae bacterium]
MKNSTKILLTLTLILIATLPILAQGPGAPPATPIDGGLSLLLAAGGAYGVKKLRELRKAKS